MNSKKQIEAVAKSLYLPPLDNILLALYYIQRFRGLFLESLSVWRHSELVYALLDDRVKEKWPFGALLCALFHDAAEALINDVPSWVKDLVPDVRFLEDILLERIFVENRLAEFWEFYEENKEAIKEADKLAFVYEVRWIYDTTLNKDMLRGVVSKDVFEKAMNLPETYKDTLVHLYINRISFLDLREKIQKYLTEVDHETA